MVKGITRDWSLDRLVAIANGSVLNVLHQTEERHMLPLHK